MDIFMLCCVLLKAFRYVSASISPMTFFNRKTAKVCQVTLYMPISITSYSYYRYYANPHWDHLIVRSFISLSPSLCTHVV